MTKTQSRNEKPFLHPVRFPVSRRWKEDLIVTPEEIHSIHMSYDRFNTIARALRRKRWQLRRASADSNKVLKYHPEFFLFLTADDLEDEPRQKQMGRKLADVMNEICNLPLSHAEDRKRIANTIKAQLAMVNTKIIKPRMQGRFQIGFRDNVIAILGLSNRAEALTILNITYLEILLLHRKKGSQLPSSGFSYPVIRQIANAAWMELLWMNWASLPLLQIMPV